MIIIIDDNVADNNDDDDDIIIEKFVGSKLGKTVKVDKTRMSKGFYQYAREKIKIKKEKELILESESIGRLTRSKKKVKFLKLMKINITNSQLRFFNKLYLL
jgi:hypothetical protein